MLPLLLDESLPSSRLSPHTSTDEIVRHFPEAFGIRVDTNGLDALPDQDRLILASARPPEPPEAVLVDRVLQLVPARLLRTVQRIVMLPTRGVGRHGGYLNGIVRVSASEADVRRPDPEYGNRFSVFTTTVAHEIGHTIYETALTPEQQDLVLGSFVQTLKAAGQVDDELSEQNLQHHFIDFFLPALPCYGRPPYSAAVCRRALATIGLGLRRS